MDLNLKKKYKNIEKYICPEKLDMILVPDVDEDIDIGKILTINEEGEVVWGDSFDFDKSDAAVKLKRLKDRIEIITEGVKDLEKDGVELHKEFKTALTVQKGEIEGVVKELESKISHNQDFIKDYIKSNNDTVTEISQVINKHSSSLNVLDKEVIQKVTESKIIGSYAPGSNRIPTRTWHNQVDPNNNGNLMHFLFKQDSGWIGSANKHFALMMAGEQYVEIDNNLLNNGATTNFALDVWLTPYTTDECTLMDGIYLFDENTNFRIKMHNLDIRTKEVLTTNELHHICVNVDIQKKRFRIFIDGKEVKIYPTINTNKIDLPEKFKLMDKFVGDVASIKIYNKYLTKKEKGEKKDGEVDINFKQGPYGQKYSMYNLAVCLEAMKAETILNDSEYWQSYIKVLKDQIDMRVKDTIYQQDKKIFDDKLKGQDERLTVYDTGIKTLRDKITSKVDIEDWRTYQAKLDDDVSKINKGLDGVEGNIKSARKLIEDNQTNINSYKVSIEQLKDALKLTVKTDEYNTHNSLYEQQLKDKLADVNDKIKVVNESFIKAEEAINMTKGQIDQYVKENSKTNQIVNNLTKDQATQIERINNSLAEIKILKNSISQKVSSEDVENIIHSKGFNSTNLLRNSTFIIGSEDWEVTDKSSTLEADSKTGILSFKNNGGNLIAKLTSDVDKKKDIKYVLSGMYSLLKNGIPCSENIKVSMTQRVKGKKGREIIANGEFKANDLNLIRIEPVKFRLSKDTTIDVHLEFTIPVGCELQITKPKFEKGFIASDWSTNSKEILNTLEQKLNKTENEIKNDLSGIRLTAKRIISNSSLINNAKKSVRFIRDYCSANTLDDNPSWTEIQVLGQKGENIAKGLTVTCSNPKKATNLDCITNGNVLSDKIAVVPLENNDSLSYVTLDLGKIYNDVAYIKIWHDFKDNRLFYNLRTEISTDGEHWTRIFDTAYNGTYCEDNKGLTLPLNAGASASSLEKRVQQAEQKVTPNAIITTITDSNELGEVIQKHIGTEIIKVEKRELGGINLIPNSGNFKNLAYWEPNTDEKITLELKEVNGEKVIYATGSIRNSYPIKVKPSQEYIYSCEIMFDKDCNVDKITPLHMWLFSNGEMHNEKNIEVTSDTVIAGGKWKRIVYTFKTPNVLSDDSYFRPIIWGDQLKDNPFKLRTIMLKEGSMLTGWEPNPEDFVVNINEAKRDLNEKINKEVKEVRDATNKLEKDMSDSFRDGIITEVEKRNFDRDLSKISKERLDVLQKCNYILNKKEIENNAELKTELTNQQITYENTYKELVDGINKAKSLEKIDIVTSTGIVRIAETYNIHLNYLSQILMKCTDYISKCQIQDGLDDNKIYMSKEMRIIQDSIIKAKEDFEKSKMQMSNEVEEAKQSMDNLSKNLDEVFKDGVVDKVELKLLEKSKSDLEKENLDVEKKCTTITSSKYLGDNYKNKIVSIKAQFDASYKDITSFVSDIIRTQKYTDQDKIKLKDLRTIYVEKLTDINQTYITMLEDIMKNNSDNAMKQANLYADEKAKAMKEAIDKIRENGEKLQKDFTKEIDEAKDSVTNLKDTVQKAIEDNVLQQVEIKLIQDSIAKVKREKEDVDIRYEKLIKDDRLQGPIKQRLINSKEAYDREQTLYNALLNEAIRRGTITDEVKNKINLTGDEYTLALTEFSETITEAIMSTTDVSVKKQLEKANNDMRKKMEDISKSLDNVIAETQKARDEMYNEITEAQKKVSEMAKNLDADMIDGFIDKKEAMRFNELKKQLDTEVKNIIDRSNILTKDIKDKNVEPKIAEDIKNDIANLNKASQDLFNQYDKVKASCTQGNHISVVDRDKIAEFISKYKNSFNNLEMDMDKAYRSISKAEAYKALKDANVETANKLAPLEVQLKNIKEDTKKQLNSLDKEYKESQEAFDNFKKEVNTTFADGIIQRAEARSLKDRLFQLGKEMQDVEAQVYTIQSDTENAPIPFTELDKVLQIQGQLNSSYQKISSTIQKCIDNGKVAPEDRKELDSNSRAYATNSADFKASLQQAINKLEATRRNKAILKNNADLKDLKDDVLEKVKKAEVTIIQTKEEMLKQYKAEVEKIGDSSKTIQYLHTIDEKYNGFEDRMTQVERDNNDSKNIIAQYEKTIISKAKEWSTKITEKTSDEHISSLIKQNADKITISAKQVYMGGNVTFGDVAEKVDRAWNKADDAQDGITGIYSGLSEGRTQINGACISAGKIDAKYIDTGKLEAHIKTNLYNGLSLTGGVDVNTGDINVKHGMVRSHGGIGVAEYLRFYDWDNAGQVTFQLDMAGIRMNGKTLMAHDTNIVVEGTHDNEPAYIGVQNGGKKHKIITTRDYGEIALNAVESGRSLFEDDGRAKTSNGKVRVFLSPIFRQTIVDDDNYDVMLTSYGKGVLAVTNRQLGYFDVEVISGKDTNFYWVARAEQVYNKGERFTRMNIKSNLSKNEQKIFDSYKNNNKNVKVKPI